MKPFLMPVEFINPETGELEMDEILIDDFEYVPKEPFSEPCECDNDDLPPW